MNIITGMHRSGTTYVGKVIDSCEQFSVFHEPFNRHFGLKGINKNYPAVDMDYELNTLDILKSIEKREKREFIKDSARDKFVKGIARKIIGGKTEQQWRKIRVAHFFNKKELVLKDPFLSMSTKTLSEDLGYKVVFLCRHPGAVWASIKQMNWKMDLNNFFGDNFPIIHQKSDLATFCEVWNKINEHNSAVNNSNFLFLTHEELCVNPISSFERIFNHFDAKFSSKAKALVEEMSNGTIAEKKGAQLHQFKRNSSEMIDLWKQKLSKEEIDYIYSNKVTGKLIKQIYNN